MIIKKYLPESYKNGASEIFMNSFSDKFMGTFKNKEKGKNLIKNSIKNENCFYAENGNELLGFVTFNTLKDGACIEPHFITILREFGFLKSLIVYLKLLLFKHKSAQNELYVEFIALDEKFRGLGIGTKLMEELLKYAQENRYEVISLLVVSSNPRAKELYKKLGFQETGVIKTWTFKYLLGIKYNEIYSMKKTLNKN